MASEDQKIVGDLVKLGLNPREAKLYYALLRTPEATPAELDRLSSVPRTKVYEVLGQMAAKGLCSERREGNKKFYRATRPTELASQLRSSWEATFAAWQEGYQEKFDKEHGKWIKKKEKLEAEREKHEALQRKRESMAGGVFTGLERLYLSSLELNPSLENAKIIRSTDQIRLKLGEAYAGCKKEMIGFNRSPYLAKDPSVLDEQHKLFLTMLNKGVSMRDVYMNEPSEREWMKPSIGMLTENGAESRFVDDLPIKMYVFDREVAMIALPSVPGLTSTDFTMLILDDPGFIRACGKLFETYWSAGYGLDEWLAR